MDEGVKLVLETIADQLKQAMILTGCKTYNISKRRFQ